MAMVPANLKKKMEATILSALAREFKSELKANKASAENHKKMAAAISEIANDIVNMLLTETQVAIGIGTSGSPTAQVSVSPGKLI
jgi:hypothetical protein